MDISVTGHAGLALQQLVGPRPVHGPRGLMWSSGVKDSSAVDAEVDVHAPEARVWVPEGSLSPIARTGSRNPERIPEHVTLGRHEVIHALLLGGRHEVRLLGKILIILHGGGVELGRKLTSTLVG